MRERRALLAAALLGGMCGSAPPVRAQAPGGPFALPPELVRPIAFAWTGTLDDAAEALAGRIGWGFATGDALGDPVPPGKPPIEVSVPPVTATAAEVARLLGEQARGRAVVVVNPATRRIEVYRYG